MKRELSTPILEAATWTSSPSWLKSVGITLAGTVLLAICANVAIPLWFTPVPLTLQPFGVLLLGLLLSPRLAATTLAAYLAEGALGLPVFAPGPSALSGMAHLLGPTGGYLMAYPFAATLISLVWRRVGGGFSWALVSAAMGDLLILACGAIWLGVATHAPNWMILSHAVLPFLPGDAIKVASAAGMAAGWQHIRQPAR
jgi:biotin transport system substrate-specific component